MYKYQQTISLIGRPLLLSIFLSLPVFAHAFGARHQLEVPLYYYVLGAGLTVMLSFVIATWLVRRVDTTAPTSAFLLLDGDGIGRPLMVWSNRIIATLGVLIFLLILSTGIWGADSPTRNFAPIFVWSLWWVGMVYIQALGTDIWSIANPWSSLHGLICRLSSRDPDKMIFSYPQHLHCWPALLLFWGFAWLEQIAPFGEQPRILVLIISTYSLFTLIGMWLFGRQCWLQKVEVFSILFSYLAAIAPLTLRPSHSGSENSLYLRPPAVGLLEKPALPPSLIALMLLLLASVSFDGFRDTQSWVNIIDWALTRRWLYDPLFWVQQQNIDLYLFLETMGLIITPLLFFLSFYLISAFSARLTKGQMSASHFAGTFVLSLLPISFAYHIAHYLTFLLLAGQLAIPVISDPFQLGWDLFGTRTNQLNVGVIGVSTTWWVAMGAVVIGHIYAVYIAHVAAIRSLNQSRIALISQLPLIALMIGYTMLSLWILAQPIVATD